MIEPYSFDGCLSLEKVDIPSSITSIGSYVFRYCSSLKEIDLPFSITKIEEYQIKKVDPLIDRAKSSIIKCININKYKKINDNKRLISNKIAQKKFVAECANFSYIGFTNELKTLLTVNHPAVAKFYGFSLEFNDFPCPILLLEYIKPSNLFNIIHHH